MYILNTEYSLLIFIYVPSVSFHFEFNMTIAIIGTNSISTYLITLVPFFAFIYINAWPIGLYFISTDTVTNEGSKGIFADLMFGITPCCVYLTFIDIVTTTIIIGRFGESLVADAFNFDAAVSLKPLTVLFLCPYWSPLKFRCTQLIATAECHWQSIKQAI